MKAFNKRPKIKTRNSETEGNNKKIGEPKKASKRLIYELCFDFDVFMRCFFLLNFNIIIFTIRKCQNETETENTENARLSSF